MPFHLNLWYWLSNIFQETGRELNQRRCDNADEEHFHLFANTSSQPILQGYKPWTLFCRNLLDIFLKR